MTTSDACAALPTTSAQQLLRTPRFWAWSAPTALARMPTVMGTFAVTTAAARFLGNADRGGTVASAFVLGLLLLGPVNGRLADQWGASRVLRVQLLGSAAAWAGLSALIVRDAPVWSWHAAALTAGLCLAGSLPGAPHAPGCCSAVRCCRGAPPGSPSARLSGRWRSERSLS
jgi:MFS family permease